MALPLEDRAKVAVQAVGEGKLELIKLSIDVERREVVVKGALREAPLDDVRRTIDGGVRPAFYLLRYRGIVRHGPSRVSCYFRGR